MTDRASCEYNDHTFTKQCRDIVTTKKLSLHLHCGVFVHTSLPVSSTLEIFFFLFGSSTAHVYTHKGHKRPVGTADSSVIIAKHILTISV